MLNANLKMSLLFILFYVFLLPAISQEAIDTTLLIDQRFVYFDSDQDQLDLKAFSLIDSLSKKYIDDQEVQFLIEAHTDDVGSDEYNLLLSQRREQRVKKAFIENGIADSLIVSRHFGESKLITDANTDRGKRLNRRVKISLLKHKELLVLRGKIIDKESKLPLIAEVSLSAKEFKSTTRSDSSGLFSLLSPFNEVVDLEILALNYFIETNSLLVTERHRDIILQVPLPKLELGKKYLFKNMLFQGNRSIMIDASERSAHHLKRFMNLHPDVCIEIGGHMNLPLEDSVKVSTSYFELSVARATEIKLQLLEEGVVGDRMVVKGYGNWEMKYPETKNEREMAYNRRVEIGIMDCKDAARQESDTAEDLERYRKSNFRRNYNPKLIETEISNNNYRLRVLLQVASMVEEGIDPNKYTYKEIFDAYPDLPKEKGKE